MGRVKEKSKDGISAVTENSEFVLIQGKRAGLSYCTCHSPDSSSLRCHLREVQVQTVRGQRAQCQEKSSQKGEGD